MKRTMPFILILAGLLTACQQKNITDDSEKLKAVLIEYFDGIKNRDIDKMNSVTTSDFILFEDGKIYSNDSLIKFLNTFPKFTADYKFDNFRITVDNNSGSMSYFNHGVMTINDTTKMTVDWLESAAFKKADDKWKLDFLHSSVRK